jgi:hypothetical protein
MMFVSIAVFGALARSNSRSLLTATPEWKWLPAFLLSVFESALPVRPDRNSGSDRPGYVRSRRLRARSLNTAKRIRLSRLARLLGHAKGIFYQIGCDRESVGQSNRLLEFLCISSIGGIA